jgi:phage/plasmid-associated DNA primase
MHQIQLRKYLGKVGADDYAKSKAALVIKANTHFKKDPEVKQTLGAVNSVVLQLDGTYLIVDTDDKEANDFVSRICSKHGVIGNKTRTLSNVLQGLIDKHHFWFRLAEDQQPFTCKTKYSKIKHSPNQSKLDLLGSKNRVIIELTEELKNLSQIPYMKDCMLAELLEYVPSGCLAVMSEPVQTQKIDPHVSVLRAPSIGHKLADDVKQYIDETYTVADATETDRFFYNGTALLRKYGTTEEGFEVGVAAVHYFAQMAGNQVYDARKVDLWLGGTIQSLKNGTTADTYGQPKLPRGQCLIVLEEEAPVVSEGDALLIKGNELRNFDTIARKILPFIRKELRYCNEQWYAFNSQTKLWGVLQEPQKLIKGYMFKCVIANNTANALKMSTCEHGTPELEICRTLQKEYTAMLRSVESLHNIALVRNDFKVDLNDDNFCKTLDQTAGKLVFSDGIYDIATDTFRKGLTYEDMLSFTLPFPYTVPTEGDMSRVRDEVMKICALEQWRYDYYMQCLGYSLLGKPAAEQVAFFMVGLTAGNGKSTLLEVLTEKMPQYVVKLNSKTFSKGNGDFKKNINSITGARIAWINEVEKVKQDIDMIKEIADGKAIKNPVLFKQKEDLIQILAKLFFVSNGELAFASDDGIKRRYRYIEFIANFHTPQAFEELEEKRPIDFMANNSFAEFLATERGFAALLALIMNGARSWLQTGSLNVPKHYRELAKAACEKNEEFAEFVGCHVVKAVGKMLTRFEIEERYAMVNSGKKMTNEKSTFRDYMATKGFIYNQAKAKKVFGSTRNGCYMDCALTVANDVEEVE